MMFFFFQAEDGIRDKLVTGVQTCALPILRGEWTLPRRNGELPSKPPLFHWMAAAAARVLGLSDATVRAPSAIAAWIMVVATFAIGAMIGGRPTGWLAAGALLGMAGFWQSAWEARVDMVFAAA